jgi:hypothetical protein
MALLGIALLALSRRRGWLALVSSSQTRINNGSAFGRCFFAPASEAGVGYLLQSVGYVQLGTHELM